MISRFSKVTVNDLLFLFLIGHIISRDDPAAGVAAFNYQQSMTKDFTRYGFATLKAYALLRDKYVPTSFIV